MAFPVSVQGSPGMEKAMTAAKKHRIGTRMEFTDGRVFYYGKAGAAITAGKIGMMAGIDHADHIKDLAVPAAYAVGSTQVTVTNSGVAVTGTGKFTGDFTTAGTYENGYLFVNDAAGEGQVWQIRDHSSATSSGTITIDFYDGDSVRTALTTSSQVGLAENPYAAVAVWDCDAILGPVVGIPNCNQTSGYYGWYQVRGPAAVLTNGTFVKGKNVMSGSTTDGSGDVIADDSSAEFLIGGCINVGATTEYSLVDLQIRS